MPLWGFLLCFFIATLWAVSPIMIAHGQKISGCTSNEINPVRSLSFFAVSLIIALAHTGGNLTAMESPFAFFCIIGNVILSYLVGDTLYFMAIRAMGISLAIPVANTTPMLAAVTSWLLLGEEITYVIVIGIAIVIAGLLLLRFGAAKDDREKDRDAERSLNAARLMKGFALAAGAAVSWSLGAPLIKMGMVASGLDPIELTFYRSAMLLFLSWGLRFVVIKRSPSSVMPLTNLPLKTWGHFLGAAVIGLTLGSILNAYCIAVMPVAIVTAITSTSPFMSAMFGHFVLKDRLTKLQWTGVVMIISGSIVISV